MTITTRQDKVLATIARVEARIAKLKAMPPAQIAKKYQGWYTIEMDIKSAEKQLANNFKKLEEAKRLDAKEEAKAAKKNDRAARLELIPECLKQFAAKVEINTINDKIRIHNYLRSLPYPEFNDYSKEANAIRADRTYWNEEKMREDVKRDIEDLVLNLMDRVEAKCGNIISTDNLRIDAAKEGCAINGWIEGDKGNARVESILAGGYNIQCLHVRVLVK